MKDYIETILRMMNKNCTRTKFSERYKNIIDSYNAGGTENGDCYEQLVKLVFNSKINLLMNDFVDMAVQSYGWIAA